MRKIFFAALPVIFALTAIQFPTVDEIVDEPETVCEKIVQPQASNWWETNSVTATGYGFALETEESPQLAKAFARRAALMDAQRNLAEQVANVRITATKNLVKTEIDAIVKFFTVVSETYDEAGNCTVVVQVPVFGVDSVAQVAFPPVEKENFPPPTQNIATQGNYTGLIIDCGDLELNPVLSPEIRDETQTIYAYGNLERQKVLERGVVGYVAKTSDDDIIFVKISGKKAFAQVESGIFVAENDSRAGKNPLVIKVSELSDDGTCPLISREAADKILAENQVSHFLDDGAVVFTGNRIRGMRM